MTDAAQFDPPAAARRSRRSWSARRRWPSSRKRRDGVCGNERSSRKLRRRPFAAPRPGRGDGAHRRGALVTCELRTGRWEDVLADVDPHAVISDPPFGARVHAGARTTADLEVEGISYTYWTADDVHAFVSSWAPRTKRWIVPLTDHTLIPAWEAAYKDAGWYAFAPVPCVIPGMTVRQCGDGPASWAFYAMPARRRGKVGDDEHRIWRALPGAYVISRGDSGGGDGRRKPMELMTKLVEDYSNRGDLVVDPCAGYGTTLRAARRRFRRAIGAEVLADVADQARRELADTGAVAEVPCSGVRAESRRLREQR